MIVWHRLRFVVNIRTKKLATKKKKTFIHARDKRQNKDRKMLQTAERSLSTIVSLRTNLEVNYTLHVDRRNNGNEGGKGRLKGTHGDVARGEKKKNPRRDGTRERTAHGAAAFFAGSLWPAAPPTSGC